MSKHLADKRESSTGGRVRAFMQIARQDRAAGNTTIWHRSHHAKAEQGPQADAAGQTSPARLTQFLRIARGRLA